MNIYAALNRPKRMSDQVFDQIKELIFKGQLEPGEPLMSEQEMAQAMNVSRSTVKKAVQRLAENGLVFQVQGKGVFVNMPHERIEKTMPKRVQKQKISLENVLEIRISIEPAAAFLAASRANESDIQTLLSAYRQMERQHLANHFGSRADTSFHMAIAFASKNPLYKLIMQNLYDSIYQMIRENLESLYQDSANIEMIMDQHKSILDAILEKDPQQAYHAMDDHIHFVAQIFKKRFNIHLISIPNHHNLLNFLGFNLKDSQC